MLSLSLYVSASVLCAPYLVTGTGNFENYFSGSAVLWPFWHPKKLPCSRKMLLLQRNMSFNVYIAYNIPLFLLTSKSLIYTNLEWTYHMYRLYLYIIIGGKHEKTETLVYICKQPSQEVKLAKLQKHKNLWIALLAAEFSMHCAPHNTTIFKIIPF